MPRILALLLSLSLMAGCSLLPEVIDETKDWSASKLYYSAKESLADANYTEAVKMFEKLEARYPYGAYAQQSQLEVAYAYYKDNEPASAIAACDRFIKLHPNHPNVDYAYYLKGLANFVEDTSLFAQFADQDMSERDPKSAREAFEAFKELATRFPQSKYAADAVGRMKYLVNNLAGHEVQVARYYYQRGAYVAAANRGKFALENYRQSPALEEGLAIMAKSYDKLNLPDLRDDALRVLKHNFPNSPYVAGDGPVREKPWWKLW
ncbi:MAG: outer membrane protein assembly factor BamD [Hydrogenophilales bacterium CG17_big_fil_post_rev_8_21_14_2_50_63_12]|nr:MAG: outer membrane protein assembly factor BamD [Hydrogenophilales bacterium CG17_big_fil_post_rev_8_21_14_2_50_63_12]PIX97673.1 MAG: outer membrane protein assembly factor BamD [Hydrogenophilales bacterium CG_4_10_14_3_um_filter_63_21]PJB03291.1 MAG: outer membrane protein assembly factor BamD [Hydrogenophilales bacterium CG_4_9_14_3_um_filter_63_34]